MSLGRHFSTFRQRLTLVKHQRQLLFDFSPPLQSPGIWQANAAPIVSLWISPILLILLLPVGSKEEAGWAPGLSHGEATLGRLPGCRGGVGGRVEAGQGGWLALVNWETP